MCGPHFGAGITRRGQEKAFHPDLLTKLHPTVVVLVLFSATSCLGCLHYRVCGRVLQKQERIEKKVLQRKPANLSFELFELREIIRLWRCQKLSEVAAYFL